MDKNLKIKIRWVVSIRWADEINQSNLIPTDR
jgi:hypothetical protein